MSNKPFYNAILAAGYITVVVSAMNWVGKMPHPPADNVFMPISVLAVLVLSVALMGFLFFYQPALLLLEGKRAEAVKLLLGTIAVFAAITAGFLVLALFVIPFVVP